MTDRIEAEWIAVDWGTSSLRAWTMRGREVLAEASSSRGMGTLSPDDYEGALLDLIGDWLGDGVTPVVVCGMAGAKQGWREAAYATVPCPPVGLGAVRPPVSDPRLSVAILPGLSQAQPADVMRGEETQIAGFLSLEPGFDGVICLPGTHTKWVHVSAGEVVSFRTFMTGEIFALLSSQSVLRHSVGDGWDDAAFADAVRDGMARPEALAARFFSLRAESLLSGLSPATARARLSGLLIGAELTAARPYWLGQRVAIVGAGSLSRLYAAALAPEGVAAETADATQVTLAGLAQAYEALRETT